MNKTKSFSLKNTAIILSAVFLILGIFFINSRQEASAASGIRISVSSSMTSQYTGSIITVNATGSGGNAPYYYKFMYKVGSGGWIVTQNYSKTSSNKFTASTAGAYTVRSYVKDSAGREVYCDLNMTIKNKYVSPVNKSTVSATVLSKGGSITVKGIGAGGTTPYKFKYYYVDQQGTQKVIKDYSTATSASIKFYYAGYYTVHCTMKDKDGKVLDKSFNITVKSNTGSALSNTSWLSSYTVFVKGKIDINGRASGGNQPYQYQYYYSVDGSAYKKIAGYTKSSKQSFTFPTSGYYKIKIIAKDYSGKTSEIIKNITSKENTNKTLSLNSTVNTTSLVDQNCTVTISAEGAGGTLPHRYAYYYKIANGEWKQIKDFSTSKKVTWKITGRGLYTFKTVLKDSADKTVQKTVGVTSITKVADSSITEAYRKEYGLSMPLTLKSGGNGATYEVYSRNPGTSQWDKLQSYKSNRNLTLRPRYLGTTAFLVNTKVNNKVTASYFKVTTFIPAAINEELTLINKERQQAGLTALKLDNNLVFVANVRAEEIEKSYSHVRPDGTKCFTILQEYGIPTPGASGENIAWGYPDIKSVMVGWMNSVQHRENILSPKFKKVGIGINGKYWTQMFSS